MQILFMFVFSATLAESHRARAECPYEDSTTEAGSFFLIRHAESTIQGRNKDRANLLRLKFDLTNDQYLSSRGMEQSFKPILGEQTNILGKAFRNRNPIVMYCSPASRALQTLWGITHAFPTKQIIVKFLWGLQSESLKYADMTFAKNGSTANRDVGKLRAHHQKAIKTMEDYAKETGRPDRSSLKLDYSLVESDLRAGATDMVFPRTNRNIQLFDGRTECKTEHIALSFKRILKETGSCGSPMVVCHSSLIKLAYGKYGLMKELKGSGPILNVEAFKFDFQGDTTPEVTRYGGILEKDAGIKSGLDVALIDILMDRHKSDSSR